MSTYCILFRHQLFLLLSLVVLKKPNPNKKPINIILKVPLSKTKQKAPGQKELAITYLRPQLQIKFNLKQCILSNILNLEVKW